MIVQDVIDAIRENGLPQIRNYYFKDAKGTTNYKVDVPTGACAVGQAAINLDIQPEGGIGGASILDSALNVVTLPFYHSYGLGYYIRHLNDDAKETFAGIADNLETVLSSEQKQTVLTLK